MINNNINENENVQLSFDLDGIIKNVERIEFNEEMPKTSINKIHAINTIKKAEQKRREKKANGVNKIVNVIVDASEGICKAYNDSCYTEKYARGIDKNDGFYKAYYSTGHISRSAKTFETKYNVEPEDVRNIDTLVFRTLCNYDERVWIERKEISHKAESYIKAMTLNAKRKHLESDRSYELRVQELRRKELLASNINLEYDLSGLMITNKLSVLDKMVMKRFANIYGYKIAKIQNRYEIQNRMNERQELRANIINKNYSFKVARDEKVIQESNKEELSNKVTESTNQFIESRMDLANVENAAIALYFKKKLLADKKNRLAELKRMLKQEIEVA